MHWGGQRFELKFKGKWSLRVCGKIQSGVVDRREAMSLRVRASKVTLVAEDGSMF